MVEVRCTVCGQLWGVITPPALPLYPRGLIAHYCVPVEGKIARVVRPPQTVEEIALVGASVGASRLTEWPAAQAYWDLLVAAARVELESRYHVGDLVLAELRRIWWSLGDAEREVVKGELVLGLRVQALGQSCGCPLVQLDNLNSVPPTGSVGLDVQREHPPGGG